MAEQIRASIRVLNGGIQALVEDLRRRWKYYRYGYSPSGAADHISHTIANLLVGNDPSEASIEIAGGLFEVEFLDDTLIAITGADLQPLLNGSPVEMWTSIKVKKGDRLKFQYSRGLGFRAYLAISGGISVPIFLGSKSTCIYGKYGGFHGRALQKGDVLNTEPFDRDVLEKYEGLKVPGSLIPRFEHVWEVRMIPGPTAAPDYISDEGMETTYNTNFKIDRNSDRSGYRLITPKEVFPKGWARSTGGVAGLHPSNIVDMGYSLPGGLNVTGDQIIILGPDGPCGGGFVIQGQVIYADIWKVFQAIPARDYIKFVYATVNDAVKARREQQDMLEKIKSSLKRT